MHVGRVIYRVFGFIEQAFREGERRRQIPELSDLNEKRFWIIDMLYSVFYKNFIDLTIFQHILIY